MRPTRSRPWVAPALLAAAALLSCSPHRVGGKGEPLHAANHLVHEHSPYLLQHAYNPVDWYPWGPEALEKARRENKPIFLSIGYSTCHWCHVMERESFENDSIAALLNADYVAIKVDREERPDLDNLYMTAVQAMTGSGGWPMSVFLTPDLKPFYAGTYFPPDDRYGRPGFKHLLGALHDAWGARHGEVVESADSIATFLADQARAATAAGGGAAPGRAVLDSAFEQLRAGYDARRGGFGGAPRFPTPHHLTFLLRYATRTGSPEAVRMAAKTLAAMWMGGLHDHLGGGFHRYSTDAEWLAPHFEKMLYDQAGLAEAYVEAYQVTRDPLFATAARDICDYVLRDLHDPAGGFHSAEDADSEGEEGRFYVWRQAEVEAALGARAARFERIYDVHPGGNWEGRTILRLTRPLSESARELGVHLEDLERELAEDRGKLLVARSARVRPHKDDKVLAGWNGMMIAALAKAGAALDEPRYVQAATRAAEFIDAHMRPGGRLLRRWRAGSAGIPGYLEDYASLARGLFELHQATQDPRWLSEALDLAREMDAQFGDSAGAGWFFSGEHNERLLTRGRDLYDGATPSATSVATDVALRLGHLCADLELEKRGHAALAAAGPTVEDAPQAYTALLQAADFALGPQTEVVIAGSESDPEVRAMWRVLHHRFGPRRVAAAHADGDAGRSTAALIPYLAAQGAPNGRATAYVCRGYACRLPVHTAAELEKELAEPAGPS